MKQDTSKTNMKYEEITGLVNFIREDSTTIETGIGVHARIFKALRTEEDFEKIKTVLLEAKKDRLEVKLAVEKHLIKKAEILSK